MQYKPFLRYVPRARAAAWFLVLLTLVGSAACDNSQTEITGNDKDISGTPQTPPPNPLGDRTNPLQTYIRAHWTNGDPQNTGGAHYGHIKIYGQSYTEFQDVTDPDAQAQFVADHYDIYMGGGTIVGEHMAPVSAINLYEPTTVHTIQLRDSLRMQDWIDDPSLNTRGYTFDDVVMHYKWDVSTWYADTPGWNPEDDTNGDNCRDTGPSEPDRTAACLKDSEVRQPDFWNPLGFRRRVKIMHPVYRGATALKVIEKWNSQDADGYFFDAVAYENWHLALDKTFIYEGIDESDPNHPMRADLLLFVPTVIKTAEEELGTPLIHFGNTVSPRYTCAIPESRDLSLMYLENTVNEGWVVTGVPGEKPMATDRRADYLDCPFTEWLSQNKGYVFTAHNPPASDRGKRFSLALFYMINHQMAFYYYKTDGHVIRPGEYVWNKQWNEYVEFDVGQPAVNTPGLPDFLGEAGTNRYFVLDTQPGYELIGRQYERADGTRILVIARIMDRDRVEGADPVTIQLPLACRLVLPDLTLGEPVTELEMVNNDGAILVVSP